MGEPLLIGIDLGTTNGKIACYDLLGNLQASAAHSYQTHYPRPGWVEQYPEDWIAAIIKGMREVVEELGSRVADVSGLALSSFGPGLVIIDDDGNPLAPCPTWQDSRCIPHGERLLEEVGNGWIGLGAPLTAFPAKLLWAIEEMPELVARASILTPIKGFLLHWLTGQAAEDPSSGPGALNWWAPAIEFAGWDIERLPRVLSPTESPGVLRESLAKKIGLKSGIPVFTSLNDGASATLGSGAINLGDSVTTIATNGAARLLMSERLDLDVALKHSYFTWPFVDGLWICGGFTYSGASSLQWLADQFGVPRASASYDELLAEAEKVPIGSRGVLFMPYLGGRGTPDPNPELRGGFLRVRLEHGRAELTRSVLEGIAYALREIYDGFSRLGFDVESVRLTGGGARSELWRQIIVDVLNLPAIQAGGDSTLGNAIVAAVGLGYHPTFQTACKAMVIPLAHEKPDPDHVAAYQRLFTSFTNTRDELVSLKQFYQDE